jgi:hypothetical protein
MTAALGAAAEFSVRPVFVEEKMHTTTSFKASALLIATLKPDPFLLSRRRTA